MSKNFFIQWDSTNSCNLRCKHCYHNWNEDKEKEMSNEEFKYMADDLVKFSNKWGFSPSIHFSGGEPLLREDLFDLLNYCNNNYITTRILTNGTLINKEVAKKLKDSNVAGVQISIDGDKKTHDSIRGREDSYELAMNGIRNASQEGLIVNISTTLMQSNKEQLEDVIINSYKAGAKKIGFQSLVPHSIEDNEFIDNHEILELYTKIDKLSQQYNNKIKILKTEVLWNILNVEDNFKEKARKLKKFSGGCGAGFVGLSVLSDGTVYPCRRLPIDIGNIKEGVEKIFVYSKVMDDLRNFDKIQKCNKCESVSYCRGCRAIAYAVHKNYTAEDPMCFKDLLKNEN